MPAFQNHICIISGQNIPEILAALHPDCGTRHLRAIVTLQMKEQATNFARACAKLGIVCDTTLLPRNDIDSIKALLDKIRQQYGGETIAMNISGGTKLMAFAAFEWANANDICSLYVETLERKIYMHSKGKWEKIPLPELIGHQNLLNIYGYDINEKKEGKISKNLRGNLNEIVRIAKIGDPTPFNDLTDIVQSTSENTGFHSAYIQRPLLNSLLTCLKKCGKLDFTSTHVVFPDEKARKWCNGLWLEEYVQSVIEGLKEEGRINSCAFSVRTVTTHGVKNELDAIFTAGNRLFIIECKSGKMNKSPNSILYKGNSLAVSLGGIFTQFMICSIVKLDGMDADRARELKIRLVSGEGLHDLRENILQWIGG